MPHQAIIAAKFGGTSVKDAASIIHLRDNIIRADPRRRAIVVSAPAGVTNMLIEWVEAYLGPSVLNKEILLQSVEARFVEIVKELGLTTDMGAMFRKIRADCTRLWAKGIDEILNYAKSRGEWVNAQIVAEVLGYEFVDAIDFVVVNNEGHCMFDLTKSRARSIDLLHRARKGIVVGGFYGTGIVGNNPRTFSRGGSDITGAILAVLTKASVYENWTDVEGIFAAHPQIVDKPRKNETMTYKELRELTFMGFKVFHEEAVAFCRNAKIPIHVRSTMVPQKTGTMIVPEIPDGKRRPLITGVAGRTDFAIVTIEKYGLNDQIGIQSKIERAFIRHGIGVNTTGSIDSVTVIVERNAFNRARGDVLKELGRLKPDSIRVQDDIALICTVGERMRNHIGISAKVSSALAQARINIVLELQGGSEINIIRGVRRADAVRAIQAIYNKFLR